MNFSLQSTRTPFARSASGHQRRHNRKHVIKYIQVCRPGLPDSAQGRPICGLSQQSVLVRLQAGTTWHRRWKFSTLRNTTTGARMPVLRRVIDWLGSFALTYAVMMAIIPSHVLLLPAPAGVSIIEHIVDLDADPRQARWRRRQSEQQCMPVWSCPQCKLRSSKLQLAPDAQCLAKCVAELTSTAMLFYLRISPSICRPIGCCQKQSGDSLECSNLVVSPMPTASSSQQFDTCSLLQIPYDLN